MKDLPKSLERLLDDLDSRVLVDNTFFPERYELFAKAVIDNINKYDLDVYCDKLEAYYSLYVRLME